MKKLIVLSLIALSLGFACTKKVEEKPLAIVNGKPITKAEYESRLAEQVARHGSESATVDQQKLKDAILNQMITEKLLLEGAAEKGIQASDAEVNDQIARIKKSYPDDAAYKAQLAKLKITEPELQTRVKDQILIAKFRQSLGTGSDDVTEEQMKAFYKEAPVPLTAPARVKMRMAQSNAEADIRKIEKEIKDKGFDKAVAGIKEGGAVIVSKSDWVQPETFSKTTADAIMNTKEGETVGPLQGMGGWYIIKVEGKEAPRVQTYDEAKEKIKSLILVQRRQGQEHLWIKQKEGKSSIVRNG